MSGLTARFPAGIPAHNPVAEPAEVGFLSSVSTAGFSRTRVSSGLTFSVTVHGGVHHAHKRQSLAKQKLWVLCASKYRT